LNENEVSLRIFVVDDEEMIATTTSHILQMEGFQAIPFTDPRLLLECCLESPPDLVISDIIMPHMDGFQLAESLRETLPRCRVILFTGQAGAAELRGLAFDQGHELEVLSKPLHPRELIAKVRCMAAEHQSHPPWRSLALSPVE
jgi:DNA-binding response OmpR family regulator